MSVEESNRETTLEIAYAHRCEMRTVCTDHAPEPTSIAEIRQLFPEIIGEWVTLEDNPAEPFVRKHSVRGVLLASAIQRIRSERLCPNKRLG